MRHFFVALIRLMFPDVAVIHKISTRRLFAIYEIYQTVFAYRKFASIETTDFFRIFSELHEIVSYISLMVS
jgi:hypothetical protein